MRTRLTALALLAVLTLNAAGKREYNGKSMNINLKAGQTFILK